MGLKYGCSSSNHWGLYSGHSPLCLGFHEATCQAREVKGIVGWYAVIWDAHVDSEIVPGLYLRILSDLCYHGVVPLLKTCYMSSEQSRQE
jgi:hypothetical protein